MKVTREIHPGWSEWQKMPKELKEKLHMGCLFGKYHYHYENKNGKVGLIHIECGVNFTKTGMLRANGMMWEACGRMDFARWYTKKEAEIAIYAALHETHKKNTIVLKK